VRLPPRPSVGVKRSVPRLARALPTMWVPNSPTSANCTVWPLPPLAIA
jgi:hypothetical protein